MVENSVPINWTNVILPVACKDATLDFCTPTATFDEGAMMLDGKQYLFKGNYSRT